MIREFKIDLEDFKGTVKIDVPIRSVRNRYQIKATRALAEARRLGEQLNKIEDDETKRDEAEALTLQLLEANAEWNEISDEIIQKHLVEIEVEQISTKQKINDHKEILFLEGMNSLLTAIVGFTNRGDKLGNASA